MTICRKCGKEGEFYAGVASRCKECHKAAIKVSRTARLEEVRDYDKQRARLPNRVEQNLRISTEWRRKNEQGYKAQTAVGNALRDGRLKRQPCWVCGEKAVAHHPDYSAPLDVVWLCQAHHKQTHALIAH